MSAQPAEPQPQPPRTPPSWLTVSFGPDAQSVAQTLPPNLLQALRRACGVLARDPRPEQSRALTEDGSRREVRGSQSLFLRYAIEEQRITVEQITVRQRLTTVAEARPGAQPAAPEEAGDYRPFALAGQDGDDDSS